MVSEGAIMWIEPVEFEEKPQPTPFYIAGWQTKGRWVVPWPEDPRLANLGMTPGEAACAVNVPTFKETFPNGNGVAWYKPVDIVCEVSRIRDVRAYVHPRTKPTLTIFGPDLSEEP